MATCSKPRLRLQLQIAPACPIRCTSASTVPGSWYTRSTGARKPASLASRPALSECEARREGVFEQATVEELDEELDRAAGALLSDLKQLTQANMEDEVEFFIRALDADLIVPTDF